MSPGRTERVLVHRWEGDGRVHRRPDELIVEEPLEFAQPVEVLLRRALADRNAAAWENVEYWLARKQAVRLIQRLDAFIANPPLDGSQHGQAGRLLPAMVAAAWNRVRKLADIALADPDDVEALVRRNLEQGVDRFFITDDNFARNRNWEAIFDRLIAMREGEKLSFRFVIQVDTLCHRIPNFVE